MSWLHGRRGDMVESALTIPLLILVTLAFVNLALAGYASATAQNAANYGARMGAMAFTGAGGRAWQATLDVLSDAMVGAYSVSVTATDTPGGQVRVAVNWQVPNFFAGLMPLFGQSAGDIHGRAEAVYRKEGW